MPLHTKKHIKNGIVALWHITETKQQLQRLLPKSWLDTLDLNKVSRHNLAARVLAHTVKPNFAPIEKDEYGKPYFDSINHKISLTHAGDYAGFMLTERRDCGIDMEEINERIRRIQSKFVREDEEDFLAEDLRGLFAIWCAKETMYKYYGLKALDFKMHMKLDYKKLQEKGTLTGHINKGEYSQTLELDYEFFENYLILHTV
ncbi:4'-phosphopantetheinyl transferase superfamily protein [Bacteroidia bacterium]|nr:4'-phosphopantetheinyl transferase superfamily protein [Bacteroidia bacterium]MDC1394896.1 4'-phosphopantetheinyl transferase superfamily protein [Bacteroidia bacterium]